MSILRRHSAHPIRFFPLRRGRETMYPTAKNKNVELDQRHGQSISASRLTGWMYIFLVKENTKSMCPSLYLYFRRRGGGDLFPAALNVTSG